MKRQPIDPKEQAVKYRAEIRANIVRKTYGMATAGLLLLDTKAKELAEEFTLFDSEEDLVDAITAKAKGSK